MAVRTWGVIAMVIVPMLFSADDSGMQLQEATASATCDHVHLIDRINQLEVRVAQLELQLSLTLAMTAKPDNDGVLRDITGRAIGYWGMDGGQRFHRR